MTPKRAGTYARFVRRNAVAVSCLLSLAVNWKSFLKASCVKSNSRLFWSKKYKEKKCKRTSPKPDKPRCTTACSCSLNPNNWTNKTHGGANSAKTFAWHSSNSPSRNYPKTSLSISTGSRPKMTRKSRTRNQLSSKNVNSSVGKSINFLAL